VEISLQPMECALDALMAILMDSSENLVEERRARR
jgi:hypothetical protein